LPAGNVQVLESDHGDRHEIRFKTRTSSTTPNALCYSYLVQMVWGRTSTRPTPARATTRATTGCSARRSCAPVHHATQRMTGPTITRAGSSRSSGRSCVSVGSGSTRRDLSPGHAGRHRHLGLSGQPAVRALRRYRWLSQPARAERGSHGRGGVGAAARRLLQPGAVGLGGALDRPPGAPAAGGQGAREAVDHLP
jgi:hypothetical protein